MRILTDHGAEEIRAPAKLVVIAPAEALAAGVARVPDNLMEALRIANRERTEDVRVQHGERDREESDADGQRHDRRCHERGAVTHAAPGVPHVLKKLFKAYEAARFVEALLRGGTVAERLVCGGACGRRVHAVGDEPV